MDTRVLGGLLVVSMSACGSSGASDGTPPGPEPAPAAEPPPKTIAEQLFAPPAAWARPTSDYLAVGKKEAADFNAAIDDLAAFDGRLFIGYGDANYNIGEKIPIEFRAFTSVDATTTTAFAVDGAGQGAPQIKPTQSGEEEINRYRILDGELWVPGVDSIDPDELWTQANTTPKGIQGNVYRLDGDTVRKRRSIVGGEHVHDVASFGGSTYAVGSGADTRQEFEGGQVFRYLWRSRDRGTSFETVKRIQNGDPGKSDTRYVHLLPTATKLWVFGYESSFVTNTAYVKNASFDGTSFVELAAGEALAKVFPDGTLPLADGTGIVWGVDVSSGAPQVLAAHVAPDGTPAKLASLAGSRVIDAEIASTGEVLFMTVAGEGDVESAKSWDVRVLAAPLASLDATKEVLRFTATTRPTCVAWFAGSLFVGNAKGEVLRAAPR